MTVAEINAAIMFAATEAERSYWRAMLTEALKGK